MWLSRGLSRGCVRMRKIFSTGLTIIGWHHPFSAYTGVIPSKLGSIRPGSRDAQTSLLLPREEVSTTTGKRSISRYPIRKINDG